jgi:hypothetical protein
VDESGIVHDADFVFDSSIIMDDDDAQVLREYLSPTARRSFEASRGDLRRILRRLIEKRRYSS